MADGTVAKRTLVWKVADGLRKRIEGGDYAPGGKLPAEPVLVEKFGFSRTVIREAIAALSVFSGRVCSAPCIHADHRPPQSLQLVVEPRRHRSRLKPTLAR